MLLYISLQRMFWLVYAQSGLISEVTILDSKHTHYHEECVAFCVYKYSFVDFYMVDVPLRFSGFVFTDRHLDKVATKRGAVVERLERLGMVQKVAVLYKA